MKEQIHPELRRYLPKSHAAFIAIVSVLVLLLPIGLIIMKADDPMAALQHFPQTLVTAVRSGYWYAFLAILYIPVITITFCSSDWKNTRLLRAATESMDATTPIAGRIVVAGTATVPTRHAYIEIPGKESSTIPWRLTLRISPLKMARNTAEKTENPTSFDGKVYAPDDCNAPIVVRTPEGMFVAERDEEQLYAQWSALKAPERQIPFSIRLYRCYYPLSYGAGVIFLGSTTIYMLLSSFEALRSNSTGVGIGCLLMSLLIAGVAVFCIKFAEMSLREERKCHDLLRHGIFGLATMESVEPTRNIWWVGTTEYITTLCIHTDAHKDCMTARIPSYHSYFIGNCAFTVLLNPQHPEIAKPLTEIVRYLHMQPDADGNIAVPYTRLPFLYASLLVLSVVAISSVVLIWILFFHTPMIVK